MKIVAFAGSTSSHSINKTLVEFALTYFDKDQVELLDLNDLEMPIFSVDKEKKGFPEAAHLFLQKMREADIIICSLAEHNRSYSAAFKNIFDWASRIELKVFSDKPMLLMSTSPGGYGGGNVMNTAKQFFPQFGADIRATFSLIKYNDNFEKGKGITNPELLEAFEEVITNFKETL